jgi:hypothetical protein
MPPRGIGNINVEFLLVLYFGYEFWKLQVYHIPPSISCASTWRGGERRIMHVLHVMRNTIRIRYYAEYIALFFEQVILVSWAQ